MTDIAIRCEGLGKQYQIGERESYRALRDIIADTLSAPFRRLRHPQPATRDPQSASFWALKDVSFDVKHGEVVGIIGRNGAGKSTLLKILSRITKPTEGHVKINGRVGSLLEVGTGFHPELTGRENIFLNGAILGMKRAEIERKFDEIVAFAEIEKFLDTPVKRYSSGMYVRLAFAVAAHLEPEILVIDEVLAVGDAAFQKKCLGKMGDVARHGRTVLFVSHNLAAIRALCKRAVNIRNGHVASDGNSEDVIAGYVQEQSKQIEVVPLALRSDRIGSGRAIFTDVRLIDDQGHDIKSLLMGSALIIEATFENRDSLRYPTFSFSFTDRTGQTVLRAFSYESYAKEVVTIKSTRGIVRCRFESLPLMYGVYTLNLWLGNATDVVDFIEDTSEIEILQSDVYCTNRPPDAYNGGSCFAPHSWEFTNP